MTANKPLKNYFDNSLALVEWAYVSSPVRPIIIYKGVSCLALRASFFCISIMALIQQFLGMGTNSDAAVKVFVLMPWLRYEKKGYILIGSHT